MESEWKANGRRMESENKPKRYKNIRSKEDKKDKEKSNKKERLFRGYLATCNLFTQYYSARQ